MADRPTVSSYLDGLPASFRVDPFVGRFLLAFERLMSGLPGGDDDPVAAGMPPGIEQTLDSASNNFDPRTAPDELLPWLAGWVATSLRQNWSPDLRRRFIANMASLYRRRGTKGYLEQLLSVYLNGNNTLVVDDSGPTPHFFTVSFSVSGKPEDVALASRMAQAIIDQEKPAHTFYRLTITIPTMQINNDPPTLQVGVNTMIGSETLTSSG